MEHEDDLEVAELFETAQEAIWHPINQLDARLLLAPPIVDRLAPTPDDRGDGRERDHVPQIPNRSSASDRLCQRFSTRTNSSRWVPGGS